MYSNCLTDQVIKLCTGDAVIVFYVCTVVTVHNNCVLELDAVTMHSICVLRV